MQSSQPPSPDLIFNTLNAFQRSAALKTAIELDVFSVMGGRDYCHGDSGTDECLGARHSHLMRLSRGCRFTDEGRKFLQSDA